MREEEQVVNTAGNDVPAGGRAAETEALREQALAAVESLRVAFAPLLEAVPRDFLGQEGAPFQGGLQRICYELEAALDEMRDAVRNDPGLDDSGRARGWMDAELASGRVEDWWGLLAEMDRRGVDLGEPARRYRAIEATHANLATLATERREAWNYAGPSWWLAVEAPLAAYFDACEGARPAQDVTAVHTEAADEAQRLARECSRSDAEPEALQAAVAALHRRIEPLLCDRAPAIDESLKYASLGQQRQAVEMLAGAAGYLAADHLRPEVAAAKLRFAAEHLARAAALLSEADGSHNERVAA